MDRKVALTILLTILTLSVCFTAAAGTTNVLTNFGGAQQSDNFQQLSVTVPIAVATSLHSNDSSVLGQPTRLEIYEFIHSNPGVHFRGICDGLGLSVGVVQYHLGVLEKAGYISDYLDGQNVRYFEAGAFSEADMRLISLARHQTTGLILKVLVENCSVLHRDLATCLGVSSQALSWQMNQLKQAGLVGAEKVGVNVRYTLNEVGAIKMVLALTSHLAN